MRTSTRPASAWRRPSDLSDPERMADALVAEDRPVAADELRAELAVAAATDRAFHVALHRHVDPSRVDAAIEQRLGREAHHRFRAADERDGAGGIEAGSRDQAGHHSDLPGPAGAGDVDGDVDREAALAPLVELPRVEQGLR